MPGRGRVVLGDGAAGEGAQRRALHHGGDAEAVVVRGGGGRGAVVDHEVLALAVPPVPDCGDLHEGLLVRGGHVASPVEVDVVAVHHRPLALLIVLQLSHC